MDRYVALIHKEKKSSFGIMFPDFPGCISFGHAMEEVIDNGREALALHVEGMRRDGETVPLPRSLEKIRKARQDWVDFTEAVVVLVPLLPPKGEPVRVNINIDSNLLAVADAAAERAHQSRSAFIARALENVLQAENGQSVS
ncbi:MAG: type II toxin-antitoxin system HicB family antitoxin [Bdellovibrionales bacterium]